MSRYGAASTSSGTRASAASHLRRISAASVSSKAKLTAACPGGRPTRAQFRARIEAALAPETKIRTASGRPSGALVHRRHVRDDDARLGQEPQLERELERVPRLLGERAAAELLGDDDRDEVGLAARQPPDLLEHRVDRAAVRVERLEQRRAVRRGGTSAGRSRGRCRGAGRGSRGTRPARSSARRRARARPPGRDPRRRAACGCARREPPRRRRLRRSAAARPARSGAARRASRGRAAGSRP